VRSPDDEFNPTKSNQILGSTGDPPVPSGDPARIAGNSCVVLTPDGTEYPLRASEDPAFATATAWLVQLCCAKLRQVAPKKNVAGVGGPRMSKYD